MKTFQKYVSTILWVVLDTVVQFQVSGQFAFPQMGAMPGQIQGPMHLQIPPGVMPMGSQPSINLNSPFQIPQQRLPVMVMPYRSKASDRKYKKRRRIKKIQSSSSSSESASSSREHLRSRKKKQKRQRKRQVLTPVISYVTRNGDIVYQKKVKKNKAEDWLELGKKSSSKLEESKENFNSQEMTMRDLKQKFDLTSKKRKHRH